MRIVADTNIVISATFWKGDSFRVMKLADKDLIKLITSLELIKEYNKIINRDEITYKVVNKKLIANKAIRKVINESIIIQPKIKLNIVKEDPNDNKIIECAVAGKAKYIVTRDKHLLKIKKYKNIKIVTPKEFLKRIKKANLLKELDQLASKSKLTKQDVMKFGKKVKKAAAKKFLKDEK